jgi:hypothetical protein
MRKLFLAAIICTGCGGGSGDQPAFSDLHPVKGVIKRAGQPVKGGQVRFLLDPEKPEFNSNSVVNEDGSYSLTTYRTTDKSGERKPGAPAGTYKVSYVPDLADQSTGGSMQAIPIPKPVTVVAGENTINLDLPPGK